MRKVFVKMAAFMAAVCCLGAFGCKKQEEKIVVCMPDGAPAVAFAKLMAEEEEVEFRVVAPAAIATKVTNKEEGKNADLCVLPLTAASKLLGDGSRYSMLGTITHGNLYLLAKEGSSFDGLSSLVGKTVGVLQMQEVPGLTFKAVLQKSGTAWREVNNDGANGSDAVNLRAISGADGVGVPYQTGEGTATHDYYLLAEPAATAQRKKGYVIVGDLQALYGGEKGYPQAVLVAKNSLLEENSTWVQEFVEKVEGSARDSLQMSGADIVDALSSHVEDKGTTTSLKASLLTGEVLGRCGIRFTYAAQTIEETEKFLNALLAVNDKAGAMPAKNFYWSYQK